MHPDIRKKLQKSEGGIGKNLSQLVDTAFEVYCNREETKAQSATVFLEQASGQFHWWARGTGPPSTTLATDPYAMAQERGPGKLSGPGEGKGARARELELCWEKEFTQMTTGGGAEVLSLLQPIKVTPQEPPVKLTMGRTHSRVFIDARVTYPMASRPLSPHSRLQLGSLEVLKSSVSWNH